MPTEILIVLALILFNGFLALSEMAVMTARKSRLRQMSLKSRRAKAALELAEQPERFLSSVQVWITLIGILTGYFGGDAIAKSLAAVLQQLPIIAKYAHPISIAISVGVIVILSVVLGELVPKRLALLKPELIAAAVSQPMKILSTIAKPFVLLLAKATDLILKLLRVKRDTSSEVTEEEIKLLVAEGAEQGVIDPAERAMVNRVLSLGDRCVDAFMTPRTQISWLDMESSMEDNFEVLRDNSYSRYPVIRGSDQEIVGVLEIKNLLPQLGNAKFDLFRDLKPPQFVPETARALQVLDRLQNQDAPMALVVDEYGDIQGLVTVTDLLTAVVGRIAHSIDEKDQDVVRRADGSLLINGSLAVDDLRDVLELSHLPDEADEEYRTAAGMVMSQFGRIPAVGESFDFDRYRFEVMDLDGARIDKILVSKIPGNEVDDNREANSQGKA